MSATGPSTVDPTARPGPSRGREEVVERRGTEHERFLASLDYALPEELIAREPPPERDGGRLLHLPAEGPVRDGRIADLAGAVGPGDLVVVNDTRVIPARVFARRRTGGRVEVFFLEAGDGTPGEGAPDTRAPPVRGAARAFLRPARRLAEGERLEVPGVGEVEVLARLDDGSFRVASQPPPRALMEAAGAVPLPPYLGREATAADAERYQTVYARAEGAVAAPTAGLHLTEALLEAWRSRGVETARVTLHVGPGTFRPLRVEDLEQGELHEEIYEIPPETAAAVAATRARGGRLLAVGTTSTRALESAMQPDGGLRVGRGRTRLFIRPGYRFRVVDRLLTNFHLPRSSLLALVSAFAGQDRVLAAYGEAVARRYRFYSYGDAMLLDRWPLAGDRP